MKSESLVSVIIPFFNDADLLPTSAASVLSQSYQNIELILVDDGSTATIAAAHQLIEDDARVKLISITHAGTAAARNAGIDAATGRFVAFLDVDDWFEPGKIAIQVAAIESSSALISHTSYQAIFPSRGLGPVAMHSGQTTGRLFPRIMGSCPISMSTFMLDRSIIDDGRRFVVAERDTDCVFFAELAIDHDFLGIDSILSTIRYRCTSAPVNLVAQIEGMTIHRDIFQSDARMRTYVDELALLEKSIETARTKLKTNEGRIADEATITAIFGRDRAVGDRE